jgi:hypothetical protein
MDADPMDGPGDAGAMPEQGANSQDHTPIPQGDETRQDGPDLETLLSEFGKGPPAQADGAPAEKAAPDWSKLDGVSRSEWLQLAIASDTNKLILQSFLDHHQQQQKIQQEKADFEEVMSEALDYLEGMPVAEDFAKRWFLSEYQLNPMLKEAWDHRRDSGQHQAHAVSVVRRMLKQMHKSAANTPDPHASEDRALVNAAMRSASRVAPAETGESYAKRVSRMSNAEFEAEREKLGI